MSKAPFAEMEILVKLGAQKESIIVLTTFAERLPLLSSHSLVHSGYFYNWVETSIQDYLPRGGRHLVHGLAHHMRS